jgi:carboxylesterase type B
MSKMVRNPVVQAEYGTARGRAQAGVSSFCGILCAAPPSGVNRMRPPHPVGSTAARS